ncbi:hypothetical protein AB4138_04045 [Vibrio sp. 10N.286.52.C3]|uniref:hypothetical protein n=1 Tax=Vibrio sp. 10N.286.52.C3 TaxID=3229713 RepID=UPI0035537736
MSRLTPDERIDVGQRRLLPYKSNPLLLGRGIGVMVQEQLWPSLIANEYIWQIAQLKGKDFAELTLKGMRDKELT